MLHLKLTARAISQPAGSKQYRGHKLLRQSDNAWIIKSTHRGKRPAEVELFEGYMVSIQRDCEDRKPDFEHLRFALSAQDVVRQFLEIV